MGPGKATPDPLRCGGRWFQKLSHFWSPSGAVSGPRMDPKIGPKLVQKVFVFKSFLGLVFNGFWAPFWGPKPRQNEPTWPPKAIPRSYDSEEKRFKKMLFCIGFYSISGTSGLPREPQDSQEASQSASTWPPEALPKKR